MFQAMALCSTPIRSRCVLIPEQCIRGTLKFADVSATLWPPSRGPSFARAGRSLEVGARPGFFLAAFLATPNIPFTGKISKDMTRHAFGFFVCKRKPSHYVCRIRRAHEAHRLVVGVSLIARAHAA